MKKILPLLLIVGVMLCVSTSCKKKGDPPALPAVNAMTINLSYFASGKSEAKGVEDNYFELASVIVNTWVPIVDQTLATPIAACKALANYRSEDAKWVDKKTWKWTFTSSNKPVEVVAVIGATNVEWTVTVDNFDWVTGTSNTEGTSGVWNIFKSSTDPTKLLQIDWVATTTAVTSVKYTCASGEYSGSYMTYTPTATSTEYNSSLVGQHNSASYSIEWNASSEIGRMKCQSEFGDSEWRAWDANRENI